MFDTRALRHALVTTCSSSSPPVDFQLEFLGAKVLERHAFRPTFNRRTMLAGV